MLAHCDGLNALIGDKDGRANRLGNHLGKQRDRVFTVEGVGSLQIQRVTGKTKHGVQWHLARQGGASSPGGGGTEPPQVPTEGAAEVSTATDANPGASPDLPPGEPWAGTPPVDSNYGSSDASRLDLDAFLDV